MAQPRNLRNPPVVEAIIDLSVRFPGQVKAESFAELAHDIQPEYQGPDRRNVYHVVLGQQGVLQPPVPQPVGSYLFRSGSRAVQSKTNGFTFSRLSPYQGWGNLIGDALAVWELYRARFNPERIVRCSVRYINRMMLPGIIDFDDYIIGGPVIPPELPQVLSEFSSTYVLPEIAPKAIARVRMGFSSVEATQFETPLLLDVDILQECDIDPLNLAEIKTSFDSLRLLKNHVFFGTLTEKAIKVFE